MKFSDQPMPTSQNQCSAIIKLNARIQFNFIFSLVSSNPHSHLKILSFHPVFIFLWLHDFIKWKYVICLVHLYLIFYFPIYMAYLVSLENSTRLKFLGCKKLIRLDYDLKLVDIFNVFDWITLFLLCRVFHRWPGISARGLLWWCHCQSCNQNQTSLGQPIRERQDLRQVSLPTGLLWRHTHEKWPPVLQKPIPVFDS